MPEITYEMLRSLWVVWLMLAFLAIVVWAFWPRNRASIEVHGRLPLEISEREP
jgi:cytochrome c oxidase cbb3-type subunit IV